MVVWINAVRNMRQCVVWREKPAGRGLVIFLNWVIGTRGLQALYPLFCICILFFITKLKFKMFPSWYWDLMILIFTE